VPVTLCQITEDGNYTEIYTQYLFHNSYQYDSIMKPYTYTTESHIRPYIRNTLLMINNELPRLHLHVNYFSQLQLINRCRRHNFDVLSRKRHTRLAGAIRVAKIRAAYAKDMIQAHLGAFIVDKNDLLAEWFCLKTYTDGHTPLICSNRPTLHMNLMPFDMDGACTIQGDGIPHPADMRSTIQIIERILLPQALSAARFCTITDYRNHDAARMCVREFVREVKQSLDDVREHLHLLQGDEIDLWQSVQNFEYNVEDTSPVIHQLFARTQPMQYNAQVVTSTTNRVPHYVGKYVRKSPNYLPQHR
jgi:hypothetical protein